MSEKKWTPGPWKAICGPAREYEGARLVTAEVYTEKVRADMPGRGYRPDRYRVDNVSVCQVSAFEDDLSVEEIHANANLIAAAPELYEELEQRVIDLKILRDQVAHASKINARWEGMDETMQRWIDESEAVMAKARGEGE